MTGWETCDVQVSIAGELVPCDKPAVAFRRDPEGPYPVCVFHCRVGRMVLLDRGAKP